MRETGPKADWNKSREASRHCQIVMASKMSQDDTTYIQAQVVNDFNARWVFWV